MGKESRHFLITGQPGIGKTTLIRNIAKELDVLHPVGFYTAEIREKNLRRGFTLTDFDGRKNILAHVDIKGGFRVGRYGVDTKGFEEFLEPILFLAPETRLIIIDEIGKMECFSAKFRKLVHTLFNSNTPVIATISLKGGGLISQIKRQPDIELFEMTYRNRNELSNDIIKRIQKFFQDIHTKHSRKKV